MGSRWCWLTQGGQDTRQVGVDYGAARRYRWRWGVENVRPRRRGVEMLQCTLGLLRGQCGAVCCHRLLRRVNRLRPCEFALELVPVGLQAVQVLLGLGDLAPPRPASSAADNIEPARQFGRDSCC